jgi:phenylalanyl-tRNA synthetase beta chain
MTISYNWLREYLPEKIEPEKLSKILTAIGLEVESLEHYESIKGGLKGLVIGEVVECAQHANADKLKVTKVNTGNGQLLQIVCGAPNVAAGQKVVVATVGTTIYPLKGEPMTMKVAKIRGVESHGMICAEDEIGFSEDHAGIMVLPDDAEVGTPASEYFKTYADWIYEIGLTPNRSDAMSHLGVAKDVCAYLSHHEQKTVKPKLPFTETFKPDNNNLPITVTIENKEACQRYSGLSIAGITVKESPQWLQDKLKAIGQKPINNIVDITNFILHETGQPLHAFDADEIKGGKVIVKNLPEGSIFTTLDGKERKLTANDLMICNAEEGMCIAGVYGGVKSGVKNSTKNIFLESAWFNPVNIRRTSIYHDLRTDAAARFEKGVDISNTVNVLKRAALLIKEIAGGTIASDIEDVYPKREEKVKVGLKYSYLKKLSGKNYQPDAVKNILENLGFDIINESVNELMVTVPYNKTDIKLPADLVEEVVRIDGLDNIEIPKAITITPATEKLALKENLKEKLSNYLTGIGLSEILTNSITNSNYYSEEETKYAVKMMNSLTVELNVLRPSMLETALESISYNINRKNANLHFFEFGKTYSIEQTGVYKEEEHFSLYLTGSDHYDEWRKKSQPSDFFVAKGIASSLLKICGLNDIKFEEPIKEESGLDYTIKYNSVAIGKLVEVSPQRLKIFAIKQPVYFIDLNYETVLGLAKKREIILTELGKFQPVFRDLAIIVDKWLPFSGLASTIKKLNLTKLQEIRLFDVFESDKLGENKKSLALNFIFVDENKTLTDKEIDGMMQQIITAIEKQLNGEIRK